MSINESEAIKVYTNPKKGLWGKTKMMKKYREMLNKVYALQRHREITSKMKKKLYKREGAIRPFFSVQVDLADFPKLQNPLNNNIRYLLIAIDVFSRYMWVIPLRTKKDLHIPMRELLNDMKKTFHTTPDNITADNEFHTNELTKLANQYKFRWWYGDPHEKFRTGIVERSIRTLRGLIKRYLTQNDTTKYLTALQDLVENYNNTEHSHIRTKPRIAIYSGQTFPKPSKNQIPILRAGDKVRVLLPRVRKFDKGDKPYYSKELYEVVKKIDNKYTIRDINSGDILKKTYYIHQLLHVKEVIKNKTNENIDRSNVGYDEGIEYKKKQRKNIRNLKGIDPKNIINENERKESERNLNYNEDEYFRESHDKPLPPKISNKQLEKKQEQLENKVNIEEEKDIDKDIKFHEEKIIQLRNLRRGRVNLNRYKKSLEKLKEKKKQIEALKKKKKKHNNLQPIRKSFRERKKPKRYGYDE